MLRLVFLAAAVAISAATVPALFSLQDREPAVAETPVAAEAKPVTVAAAPKRRDQAETGITGRKMMIRSDNRGHYVSRFRLNGREVKAMIDTGATMVAINHDTARRIGLSLTEADFKHTVSTANGETRAAAAIIDSIEVGRIRVTNVQVAVLRDGALTSTLIGMSFLNKLRSFQISNGKLTLEQ